MKIISLTLVVLSLLIGLYFSLINLSNVLSPIDDKSTKYASTQTVDYQVTFTNMETYNDDYIELNMKLDTHTIDLDESIKKENINISINNITVDAENIILDLSGSGHHISYLLRIKLSDLSLKLNDINELGVQFNFADTTKEIIWNLDGYEWGDN